MSYIDTLIKAAEDLKASSEPFIISEEMSQEAKIELSKLKENEFRDKVNFLIGYILALKEIQKSETVKKLMVKIIS